ncbi:MAG TPA: KH domain-containing protein [Ignavibacteria bacterium]|nr:KH domain-containing protein [Ignavibacteria bacterium]
MKEFIEYIAKNLVDKPEGVIVEESVSAGVVHYQLLVDPGETGKVIGKKGKTAKAMRVLLIAVGAKNGKKVSLEIPDRVLKES